MLQRQVAGNLHQTPRHAPRVLGKGGRGEKEGINKATFEKGGRGSDMKEKGAIRGRNTGLNGGETKR